jgi:hypothetical protein
MRRTLTHGGPIFVACLALIGLPAAFADTTTVTTKTTTVNTLPSSFTLPASSYVLVDPLTGAVRGDYTMGTRVIDGVPLSGNYVVMDKVSRRLVGTFDSNGNLIDISAAPAASNVVVSVDSHRTALERQIAELLAQGQISSNQAAAMRLEIARLFPGADQTVTTRTVTYSNALAADSGLYTVESRLLPFSKKTYTSTVTTPRFVSVNGELILPDSIDYRRLQLERRMEDEFAFGHLTRNQLSSLKSDMTDITNREARYKENGPMSADHAANMTADLDSFQARLEHDVASVDAGHSL